MAQLLKGEHFIQPLPVSVTQYLAPNGKMSPQIRLIVKYTYTQI